MVATRADEKAVWMALAEVPDPAIPAVSVVDLGMVHSVDLDGERLRVALLPTFVGCPALDLIRQAVAARLAGMAPDVQVEMTFAEPWTSERITADGRRALRESGFAPPRSATCPFCGSGDTRLENPFGPTRCRAIFWCNHCRQPFEQFKAI
ncbi:MAG TPA: 1,2-phenylacetyl-CoA epoxidase subunit PaaD [Actinomycetota bacterium]|jgi:ring-1,2-phenylacetyl-CoA epoxidase subunit PaaD|nr:1,2-phenylacetyl-CoA epoxidase subunit PaaD [Actinomycetota bacterium]